MLALITCSRRLYVAAQLVSQQMAASCAGELGASKMVGAGGDVICTSMFTHVHCRRGRLCVRAHLLQPPRRAVAVPHAQSLPRIGAGAGGGVRETENEDCSCAPV